MADKFISELTELTAVAADDVLPIYDTDGAATKKVTPINILDPILDTDGTLAANSDTKVATQKAVKTYSDSGTQTMTNKTLTSPTFTAPVLGTPASGTLTNCTGLPVAGIAASTATALGVGSIELGHASDTSIARVSAGVASIEGVNIVTTSSTDTLTNKTLTSPTMTTPVLGTPASGTLTNCTGLPVAGITASTSTALGVGTVELGHASDTTLARVSAGVVSIEGVNVVTTSSTDTLTNKTLTSPTMTAPVLGTPASGTLTNCTGLPVAGIAASTATALGVGSIELGHASDTSIARVSAGVVSIEGVNVLTVAGGTMTGDIQLGETDIKLDAVLSGDETWSGTVIAGTAGATIAVGDLCYKDPTDSRWELADANVITSADGDCRGTLGICVLAGNDGDATEMLIYGKVRSAAFPAFTVNEQLFVSETAGDITHTAPTTTDAASRVVGVALTAEDMLFNPSPVYWTHT